MFARMGLALVAMLAMLPACVAGFQSTGTQKAAQEACGLPTDYYATSHCFADATHHTCCMLGPEARAYADASGNPIGTAAARAYKHLHGHDPDPSEPLPWCTCFGSLVCSAYASKFADTGIKFIFDPSGVGASTGGMAAVDVPRNPSCEAKARTFFDVTAHATPGVDVETSLYTDGRCPLWDPKMHMVEVEEALDKHPVDFKVTGRQKSVHDERNVGRRVDEY